MERGLRFIYATTPLILVFIQPNAILYITMYIQCYYEVIMVKKLKKIGNSQGIIIDKAVLELLKITMDTPLEIETDGQNLIIKPIREAPTNRQSRIAELTNKVSDTHQETFRRLAQ